MIRLILIPLIGIIIFITFPTKITTAQTFYSNSINTKVGNPTGPAPVNQNGISCPVLLGSQTPGQIICGPSKPVFTNYSGCNEGHCAGNYCTGGSCPGYCYQFPATNYAADIAGPVGYNVYIPSLIDPSTGQSHTLTCNYVGFSQGEAEPNQIITQFSCLDDVNNNSVWLQFHHIINGTEPTYGTYKSGSPVAGQIASQTDGTTNHVHIQIGINGGCSGSDDSGCVPADKYLQCNS